MLAADAGYPPAMDVLAEFKKRGINATPETQTERDTIQANPAYIPGPSASGLSRDDTDVASREMYDEIRPKDPEFQIQE